MDRIDVVLPSRSEPQHLTLKGEHRKTYKGNVVRISDVLRRENLLQLIEVSL